MEIPVQEAEDNVGWVEATTFLQHRKMEEYMSVAPRHTFHDKCNGKAP